MDLKKRATRASAWVATGYGTSQVIRLATNLVMTRLLVPEAFGLMAVMMAIWVGLDMISDMGIRGSVVYHKRGGERIFLNTAWTLQIIRGAFIWGLALLASGLLYLLASKGALPAGTIYTDPLLPQVVAVSTFASVVKGFESINLHVASRNLALGRLAILEVVGQAVAVPVMVIWALQDASVWALVAGGLASSVVRVMGSHLFIPGPRSRLGRDAGSFWEMFHFGKWILISSMTGFVVQQGDRLLMAAFLTTMEMGYYAIAILLIESPRILYSKIVDNVLFPAASEAARDSTERLSSIYYKFRARTDALLFLAAGLLFILGDDVVRLLYDDRYLEAGWMLQILSASLFLSAFGTQGAILLSLGKSRLLTAVTTTGGLLLLISIPVFFHYFGLTGAVIAAAIRLLWGIPVGFWAMSKLGVLKPKRELLFAPVFLVGLAVGLALEAAMSRFIFPFVAP